MKSFVIVTVAVVPWKGMNAASALAMKPAASKRMVDGLKESMVKFDGLGW